MSPSSPESRWFARDRNPQAARSAADAFLTWQAGNPENAVRYEQCQLTWERAGELVQDEDIKRLLERLDRREPAASPSRARSWALAAAAASLTLVAAMLMWQKLRPPAYETAIGEQRDLVLADGSRVTLNTASRLVVRYDDERRRLELAQGEALFDVRKDPARPFEVSTGSSIARALGTRFAVRRGANDAVTVSVLDGVVEIVRSEDTDRHSVPKTGQEISGTEQRIVPKLRRGEAASVDALGKPGPIVVANLKRIEAWQGRKLEFEAEPLASALAEVNRYSDTPLVLGSPELAALRISGVFRTNEMDGFAFALEKSFGLRIVRNGSERLVLPGGDAGAGSLQLE